MTARPMTMLRDRLGGWLGRKYVERIGRKGIDSSTLALVPEDVLTHFKRKGLDPVPGAAGDATGEPMTKVTLPFGMDAWLVTGYQEVRQVLAAPHAFSNDFTTLSGTPEAMRKPNPGGLGFADPPDHTRLRRILTPEFTVRRIQRLAPRIDAIVAEQLDAMEKAAAHGQVDVVEHYAWPIPSLMICELLGVPYEDRAEFQRLSTQRFDLLDGIDAAFGAMTSSNDYLQHIVDGQRRDPGDGLLGMIVQEHGEEVSDAELVGLADGVLTGGLETSASMLALGTLVLLRNPEAFRAVRDEDETVDDVVEELLRYLSVVQMAFPRFAVEDVEIGGRLISRGDIVLCSLLRANRDEAITQARGAGTGHERFLGMGEFDAARGKLPHLAFGHGLHRCIGAELARMELRAAYPALLRRFPEMRLAVPERELSFRKLSIVYGMDSLPVTLG
ncbi:cytochrome P450 [Streptomyces sp. ODS28]|uniref:cytochrome P450 n=1 Tax=Streptomyces sp. ODS28 TaxID=3136688 RepID=UPI0031E77F5A